MAKRKITEDMAEEILGRAQSGQDAENIALKVGLSTSSVRKFCKEAGVKLVRQKPGPKPKKKTEKRHTPVPPEQMARINKLYAIIEIILIAEAQDLLPANQYGGPLSNESVLITIKALAQELLESENL